VPLTGQTLKWYGGPWAHVYDVYFGTDPNPPLFAANQVLGPSETTSQNQTFTLPALGGGTTYYWKIVSKTAANLTRTGDVWSFTTAGTPPPPPPPPSGATTIVLWSSSTPAAGLHGNFAPLTDATASGGAALRPGLASRRSRRRSHRQSLHSNGRSPSFTASRITCGCA
jgi:hypothetical protein